MVDWAYGPMHTCKPYKEAHRLFCWFNVCLADCQVSGFRVSWSLGGLGGLIENSGELNGTEHGNDGTLALQRWIIL